jgi:uncharacterized Zn-binding protein involved in type VI secretion
MTMTDDDSFHDVSYESYHGEDASMSPAAKEGDRVIGVDVHLVDGAPAPFPFEGRLDGELSPDVFFDDKAAATIDSTVKNDRTHVPPPTKKFDRPPANRGVVVQGAERVLVNDRPLARHGHRVKTCNDPVDLPTCEIVAEGTVLVGGD